MTKRGNDLGALLQRQEQLAARIESLKAKEAVQQRKDETRRKILAGAYILDKHEKNGTTNKLISELADFLFKQQDRALFGLPPKVDSEKVPD